MRAAIAFALLAASTPDFQISGDTREFAPDIISTMRVLQPFANNLHKLEYAAQVSALINAIRDNEEITAMIERLEKLGVPPKDAEEEGD